MCKTNTQSHTQRMFFLLAHSIISLSILIFHPSLRPSLPLFFVFLSKTPQG